MRKLLTLSQNLLRLVGAFVVVLSLTTALWVATIPVASARLMTPAEMIEAGLPPGVVIKSAGKPQFLTALCAAVRNHHKDSAAIAHVAAAAHKEYAGDIVATVVRCLGDKPDCELVGSVVADAIGGAPDSAVQIDDAAVAIAPACADAIEKASRDVPAEAPGNYGAPPALNEAPLPGDAGGGGGFNPQDSRVPVCDMGQQRSIRASRVDHYLRTHPGSFVGHCDITPAVSR
jgi:hypothetical protein